MIPLKHVRQKTAQELELAEEKLQIHHTTDLLERLKRQNAAHCESVKKVDVEKQREEAITYDRLFQVDMARMFHLTLGQLESLSSREYEEYLFYYRQMMTPSAQLFGVHPSLLFSGGPHVTPYHLAEMMKNRPS